MSAIRYPALVATSRIRLSPGRERAAGDLELFPQPPPRVFPSGSHPLPTRRPSAMDAPGSDRSPGFRRARPSLCLRFSAQVRLEADPCHSESSSPSPRSSRRSRPSRQPLPPPPRSHSTWRRRAPATCCARSSGRTSKRSRPARTSPTRGTQLVPGSAYPTIVVRNGSTTGVCNWDQPGPTVLAICSFSSGTGRLTQFHLVVDVSVDADNVWHWDGIYWFGPGH